MPVRSRLFLVGDDPPAGALRAVLDGEPDFDIVGTHATWWKAASALREARADACIVDITSAGPDGALALRRFHQIDPALRIVALVDQGDRRGQRLVDDDGRAAVVLRQRIASDLLSVVRRALAAAPRMPRPSGRLRMGSEPAWAARPRASSLDR